MYHGFHQNIQLHNGFQHIDNNQKCFLSGILLWFLMIMWHWRSDAENTALIKGIKYILQYIYIEIVILFHNITCVFNQINAALKRT